MASRPVSEVLLEAAEYLCKLGHNLKLRSETLKIKRLHGRKLKTTDSVKKASNKMLLICSMSKQSIDNVENTVKKVLEVCNDTIADHKTSSSESGRNSQPDMPVSTDIKIPKNINIDHYLACKVIVRNMTLKEISIYFKKPFRKSAKIRKVMKERQSVNDRSDSEESTIEETRLTDSHVEDSRRNSSQEIQNEKSFSDLDHTEMQIKQLTSSKEESKVNSEKKEHKRLADTNIEDFRQSGSPIEAKNSSEEESNVDSRRKEYKKKIKHKELSDSDIEDSRQNNSLSKEMQRKRSTSSKEESDTDLRETEHKKKLKLKKLSDINIEDSKRNNSPNKEIQRKQSTSSKDEMNVDNVVVDSDKMFKDTINQKLSPKEKETLSAGNSDVEESKSDNDKLTSKEVHKKSSGSTEENKSIEENKTDKSHRKHKKATKSCSDSDAEGSKSDNKELSSKEVQKKPSSSTEENKSIEENKEDKSHRKHKKETKSCSDSDVEGSKSDNEESSSKEVQKKSSSSTEENKSIEENKKDKSHRKYKKETKPCSASDAEESKSDNKKISSKEVQRKFSRGSEEDKREENKTGDGCKEYKKTKKYRHIRMLSSSSESDKNNENENKMSPKNGMLKSTDLPSVDSTISESKGRSENSGSVCISSDDDGKGHNKGNTSGEGSLKLIDINKLLKPGLVTPGASKSKSNIKKAVRNFKAKEFKILLEKYELTKHFMKKHKITAIIKDGLIIKSLSYVRNQEKQVSAESLHGEEILCGNDTFEENLPNDSGSDKEIHKSPENNANNDTEKRELPNESKANEEESVKSPNKDVSLHSNDTEKQMLPNEADSNEEESVKNSSKDINLCESGTEKQRCPNDSNANEEVVESTNKDANLCDNDMEQQGIHNDSDSNNDKVAKSLRLSNDEYVLSVNDAVKQGLLEDSDSSKEELETSLNNDNNLPDNDKVGKRLHVDTDSSQEESETCGLRTNKNMKSVDDQLDEEDDDNITKILDIKQSIDQIKNALLAESDSDDDVDSSKNNIDNVKISRPDDVEISHQKRSEDETESNSDPKNKNDIPVNEELETSSKNDSKKESEPNSPINQTGADVVKNSLLQDSDGEEINRNKDAELSADVREADGTPGLSNTQKEVLPAKETLLGAESSDEDFFDGAISRLSDILKVMSRSSDYIDCKKSKRRHSSSSSSDDQKSNKTKKRDNSSSSSLDKNEKSAKRRKRSGNDGVFRSKKKMGRSKLKTGGSSEPSSDATDTQDKQIYGLANLNSLKRRRRRRERISSNDHSSSNDGTNNINTDATVLKQKVPVLHKDMLEAESSSSGEESENNSVDSNELPAISLPDLNGSAQDHLVKEDLLNESDTSTTDNKDSDNTTKKESDTENAKSKRCKGNTISSDSEGGSLRKKAVKFSDFEDSDEDGSDVNIKRNKRRKMKSASESDASHSGEEDGKKKRKRIKQINDSEGSGSDSENEGKKHGRKNIRKVMGKDQLEEATKKAAREEKERIARISERQKLYNNLAFDESGKPDEIVLDKVVLDFDPETKEPLIQVDRGLVKKLKPHQANGIKFMWDACFESVKRIKKDKGSGCILAHCMGLGKTLQVVSLTHTLLTHSKLTGVNRVLVVCPLSTVLNWVNEYKMWLKHAHSDKDIDIYELSRYKQNFERAYQLQEWLDNGGVCVLGYEMFRNLSADNSKKYRKKMLKSFQESLVDPGPDLVVCDEGHLLKNEKTSLSQSMNRVKTLRRIVLTGTPLQNNLKEYYCMVQFVKPNLLGKYNEYLNRFVNPITNGQYTDSTEHDIKVMKRRSHVLHKMLDGAVQRRDYGVLAPFLPPKHEYVLFITLTDVQAKLYQHYLDNYSRRPLPGKSSGFLFPDFQSLQRIWTHPLVLKYNSERYEIMQQKKREREEEDDSEGSLADFIDDDSTPEESTTEDSSDSMSGMSDDSRKKSKKKANKKSKAKDNKASTRRGTRANPGELEDEKLTELEEVKNENPTEWWIPLVSDDEIDDLRNSHKLVLLFDILRQCEAIGDKLLVFSQSLYSLDLIEHFLGKVDEATQEGRIDEKLGGHVGSWSQGIDYFRLDGSTSCENRSIWCKNFNREDNPRARLFLISTRAGGLGINLVAANRVVIFDVSWNPSHDVQSIFRVYRFGQKKPCYVYRFLAMGTMEEKIYERQVTKQAISKRVIDEQQIDRHYAENDLTELYKFEPVPLEPRALPPLPKDRLFAEMLKEYEKQIYKYHEHDSLLENKEEETLTEEERKAAWEDFENEKTRPPPSPFAGWSMQSLMHQQQQHQFALNTVVAMLRKDYPNLTEQQLAGMMPLIYNANPALMQKMNDLYKYATPNPSLMGQMMNPGALGSTSSLQYEPPWQRQQQQLRLQQMLQQQQQSMNAKYYAGGLGSRDPVAMALQQQRAREMLVGDRIGRDETRGRPRGRPPLHRLPPVTTDIVDLDSD